MSLTVGLAYGWTQVLAAWLALALPIELETVSGDVVSGTWAGTSKSAVKVVRNGKTEEIPFDQLSSLRPQNAPAKKTAPPQGVGLVGGSEIYVQSVKVNGPQATLQPKRQDAITLPLNALRWIRFRPGSAKTDPQWLGLIEKDQRSDLMVIRRAGEQLDPIEGVVEGLADEKLRFSLDGDVVEAPVDRLEGVVFRSSPNAAPKPKVKVVNVFGSVFYGDELKGNEEEVRIVLAGAEHRLPIDYVASITWASGQLLLAELESAASELRPHLPTQLNNDLVSAWFGPQATGQDLTATAGGWIEYRVDNDVQSLAGSVRKDDGVSASGSVTIQISLDGQSVWNEQITGTDTKGFRIPVVGGRRVRLEVLPGDDGDIGDQVRFVKPRFLK